MSGTTGGRRPLDDAGTATVLAAAAVGVLVLLLGLGLQVGAATIARHRAESAADLGALAGARAVVRGRDVACGRAEAVVAGNGARLVACSVEGWTVVVDTATSCGCVPSVSGDATGRARAGPVAGVVPPSGRPPVTGGDRWVEDPGRAEPVPG